ncbi:hypothetical protein KUTeg_013918 [Tegillarca granosa]|uniref:THIF-type NAD/FAD binding fold domain-containing protein n=1 Tax=Tegillarca granosa TaxID=220873 RepID=A0ABQ9EVG4_TEGGR|nr:hypothetical protein KUTeg_013918 [Tegillarca granosa]
MSLRASRVLLIGVRGLGAEVAKNIVLSGIKSLTLMDHSQITEEDASSQFLVNRADVGKNNAVKFFAGDVFGFYGYMFSDLGVHEYADSTKVKGDQNVYIVFLIFILQSMAFKRLKEALETDWTTPDAVKKLKKTPNTYFIMKGKCIYVV